MTNIKAHNISFQYSDNGFSLHDIEFDIDRGEIFGIIGPNGSGKSTLLKCISGQFKPTKGYVEVENTNVLDLSAVELSKKMSLIQQHSVIGYNFTVLEIVLMGRNPYLSRFESYREMDYQTAEESLKRVEIFHLKDRDVTTLSGGEWQRMVIARALCQQALIMLLDEPVAGLDIKHQVQLMKIVKQLSIEENLTVVCVLHNLNLAYHYCDKIIILKQGSVMNIGTPKDVMTKGIIESVYESKINLIKHNKKEYLLPEYEY